MLRFYEYKDRVRLWPRRLRPRRLQVPKHDGDGITSLTKLTKRPLLDTSALLYEKPTKHSGLCVVRLYRAKLESSKAPGSKLEKLDKSSKRY